MVGLKLGLLSVGSVLRIGSICLAGTIALAAPAGGLSTQAAIIGVVTDRSGAILPGVTVVATSPALQVRQVDAVTNERGEYRLSPLPVGTYNVTTSCRDFRRSGERVCGWRSGSSPRWIHPAVDSSGRSDVQLLRRLL